MTNVLQRYRKYSYTYYFDCDILTGKTETVDSQR